MKAPAVEGPRLRFRVARQVAKLLGPKPDRPNQGLQASDRPNLVLREIDGAISVYVRLATFDGKSHDATAIRKRILKVGRSAALIAKEIALLRPYLELLPGTRQSGSAYVPTAQFVDELALLARVAATATEVKAARGAPKHRALRDLIVTLADIYRDWTDEEPATSWRDGAGEYDGNFVALLKLCTDASGLRPKLSTAALGSAFLRVLARPSHPE